MSGTIEVITKGKSVSNRKAALTFEIANQTGSKAIWNEKENIIIQPWTPICPENVIIPSDLSLAAFGLVLATAHDTSLDIVHPPNPKDGIGAEILYEIIENKPTKEMHLDLLNCNDLLPALSASCAPVTASAPRAVVSTSFAVKCSVPTTSSAIKASVTASAVIPPVFTFIIAILCVLQCFNSSNCCI